MLTALPTPIRFLLLCALGFFVGAFINWAIYAWAMIRDRRISPWQQPHQDDGPRTWIHRIPIFGWYFRTDPSERKRFGTLFWLRPMLIEIGCTIALPLFFEWLVSGGLTGGIVPMAAVADAWFWALSILITLMLIGTFIDFDEKTIPDQVTITGTIIALFFAALVPDFRLPQVIPGLAGATVESIHYQTPEPGPMTAGARLGVWGLVTAVSIYLFWIFALWPKLSPFYVGLRKSFRLSWAHSIKPARRTRCDFRKKPRQMPTLTKVLAGLLLVGLAAIPVAWSMLPNNNWISLLGALVGLAFGALLIWLIRIVGTMALQKEAMGFGDVTLMAMIGAFLGWQATLIAFVYGIMLAFIVVVTFYIFAPGNELPFGPYLCGGALLTILTWGNLWPVAAIGAFQLRFFLWAVLAISLILMAILLVTWAWLRGDFREEAE